MAKPGTGAGKSIKSRQFTFTIEIMMYNNRVHLQGGGAGGGTSSK